MKKWEFSYMKPKKNKYAAEGRFAILLKLIAERVVFSNDRRNIVEANESFEKVCGLKREGLIGKNAFDLSSSKRYPRSVTKKLFLKIVIV